MEVAKAAGDVTDILPVARWGDRHRHSRSGQRPVRLRLLPAETGSRLGNPRSATLMGLKLCVLRARRVRGLDTSDSGLTAYRRLVGIEGLLVMTPFGLRPDLDEDH